MAVHGHYHVLLQGTAASRPATPGFDLAYYATDTATLSIYDTVGAAWTTLGGPGGFDAIDPLTTKGDQIVHDGTNSVRVPVGTNGQEWIADSSDTEGIVWRTSTARVTTDQSTSSTTATDIPGLSIAILASRNYAFDLHLMTQTSVSTEANYFSVSGPSTPTNIRFTTRHVYASPDTATVGSFTAYDGSHALTGGFTGGVTLQAIIRGTIENGSNAGNFVGRFWTETGGSETATVRRGSWMRVWEIP